MTRSKLELTFIYTLKVLGHKKILEEMVEEYKFHPDRKFRFDFCFPDKKIAIEIDGGQYKPNGGRHNSDSDREKMNEAAVLGWRVLRFSGTQLKNDPIKCVKTLLMCIGK